MISRRIAIAGIALALVTLTGCQTLEKYVPFVGDKIATAVNVVQFKQTLEEFEYQYVLLRAEVSQRQDEFSQEDWFKLTLINDHLVEARQYLDELIENADDPTKVSLNIHQIERLIRPIQRAGLEAIAVMDNNQHILTGDSVFAYRQTANSFLVLSGQVDEALSDPDADRRIARLRKLLYAGSIMFKAIKIGVKLAA